MTKNPFPLTIFRQYILTTSCTLALVVNAHSDGMLKVKGKSNHHENKRNKMQQIKTDISRGYSTFYLLNNSNTDLFNLTIAAFTVKSRIANAAVPGHVVVKRAVAVPATHHRPAH